MAVKQALIPPLRVDAQIFRSQTGEVNDVAVGRRGTRRESCNDTQGNNCNWICNSFLENKHLQT